MPKLTERDSLRIKSLKQPPVRRYYLNDYLHGVPRFRIESTKGGELTRWTAITSLQTMERTKRYLEKVWGE